MTTYIQCHTSGDAAMYVAALREEGYVATRAMSRPTVVEVSVDNAPDEEALDSVLFDVYSRRVAN